MTGNSVRRSKIMFRHKSHDQNTKFRKFKMADGRHLKKVFFAISQKRIIRFQRNLVSRRKFWFQYHLAKYQNFANPIWRLAAILKIVFGYISTIYCPINVKFGKKKQVHVRHRLRDQNAKFRKFKMADGCHFENGLIAISQPIIIRFQWRLVGRHRFSF